MTNTTDEINRLHYEIKRLEDENERLDNRMYRYQKNVWDTKKGWFESEEAFCERFSRVQQTYDNLIIQDSLQVDKNSEQIKILQAKIDQLLKKSVQKD